MFRFYIFESKGNLIGEIKEYYNKNNSYYYIYCLIFYDKNGEKKKKKYDKGLYKENYKNKQQYENSQNYFEKFDDWQQKQIKNEVSE